MRNPRFDIARGWLIVAVIAGHIVLGSIHSQPLRYAIYSFHMPLFIVLTGYLINVEKLRTQPLWQSAWRYWQRMAVPFIPALLFFTGTLIVHAYLEGRLSGSLLMAYATTPYYHLWYIPTVLIWVGGLALLLKLRVPLLALVILSLPLPILWAGADLVSVPALLLDKKLFFYAFFFFFGLLLRQVFGQSKRAHALLSSQWRIIMMAALGLSVGLFAMMVVTDFGSSEGLISDALKSNTQAINTQAIEGDSKSGTAHALAWFAMNVTLSIVVLQWCLAASSDFLKIGVSAKGLNGVLSMMGRLSLPIYLWHVVPMFILKGLGIHQSQPLIYYCFSIAFTVILVFVVAKFEHRYELVDRLLYGQFKR